MCIIMVMVVGGDDDCLTVTCFGNPIPNTQYPYPKIQWLGGTAPSSATQSDNTANSAVSNQDTVTVTVTITVTVTTMQERTGGC